MPGWDAFVTADVFLISQDGHFQTRPRAGQLPMSDSGLGTQERFEGTGPDHLVDIGPSTCLNGSTPVPCTDPHQSEVLSVGEYDAPAGAPYPDFASVLDELAPVCDAAKSG